MASEQSPVVKAAMVLLPLVVGYVLWSGSLIESVGVSGLQAQRDHIAAVEDTISTLEAQTDSAKKELARGTVEDLRRRLDQYRGSLQLMRRLVPERNEVPNLLDAISTRAKIRGVNLSQVVPLPEEAGPAPFNTDKYQMQVIGHYDQIGQFLADVASLERIIVPYDVSLTVAQATAAKALGDSTGSLLEAKFQIRTYVKSATADDEQEAGSGT